MSKVAAPLVLVVGSSGSRRRALSAQITPRVRARELEPGALAEAGRGIDAAAALVLLDADDDERLLKQAEALAALPAGGATILLLDGVGDELARAAIERLAPAHVLAFPAPTTALRFALERCLARDVAGEGARVQQRRAPALLGVSSAIRDVIEQVKRIGPSHIPALILGETGTGKELVARAIHQHSPRANDAFVALNCGALPDSLLESELFGHRKGSFTGADLDKPGLFETADGGTLFLDEIADTSPALQVKLLRALEAGEIRPVGGTHTRRVDVRFVSATHDDLEAAVEEGRFRRDLFYRINTVTIHVPPLRRRPVDVPFLAQHFAEEFGAAHARRIILDEEFLDALGQRAFPGNVRELKNAVERAIALASPDEKVSLRHLDGPVGVTRTERTPRPGTLREQVERLEIELIRAALDSADGNRTRAAEQLGLSRLGLRKKMRRLGIEEPGRR